MKYTVPLSFIELFFYEERRKYVHTPNIWSVSNEYQHVKPRNNIVQEDNFETTTQEQKNVMKGERHYTSTHACVSEYARLFTAK